MFTANQISKTNQTMSKAQFLFILFFVFPISAVAMGEFSMGPVFEHYGENIQIRGGLKNPKSQQFKVVFDISAKSEGKNLNRKFNGVARFINMHARAGVATENIELAMVVHGQASFDLINDQAYSERFGHANPNSELINLLSQFGVKVILCGQSASFHGLKQAELNPNVELSLSAMTANALLQQQGYTLNPF